MSCLSLSLCLSPSPLSLPPVNMDGPPGDHPPISMQPLSAYMLCIALASLLYILPWMLLLPKEVNVRVCVWTCRIPGSSHSPSREDLRHSRWEASPTEGQDGNKPALQALPATLFYPSPCLVPIPALIPRLEEFPHSHGSVGRSERKACCPVEARKKCQPASSSSRQVCIITRNRVVTHQRYINPLQLRCGCISFQEAFSLVFLIQPAYFIRSRLATAIFHKRRPPYRPSSTATFLQPSSAWPDHPPPFHPSPIFNL